LRHLEEIDKDGLDDTTMSPRDVFGLTELEIRLLVALCEPRLRNPRLQAYVVPSTAALCDRLDISAKKVEGPVDGLVVRMAPHVAGVIGSNEGRAVTRRHRIAAFALDARCVTASDLRLLDLSGD
jgi:hypothetical protein